MANVEEISMSLVREFLNRKGLKTTLQSMDTESPRTVESISSRTVLCKALHIERLVRKNKELATPFKTIIEVIVGYFIDKGKKSHEDASDKAVQENKTQQITTGGIISNQTLLPDSRTIRLIATTEENQSQPLKLGTQYEKLLQDDDTRSVASKSTIVVDHKGVQDNISSDRSHDTPLERSHDTTPSSSHKRVTPSLASQHSGRHKQIMISRTAQPLLVGGSSKSKRAKPLRISHKLKESLEEANERATEDLTTQQSSGEKMVPAAKPITKIEQKKVIPESLDTPTHTTYPNRQPKQHDHVMELEDITDNEVYHFSSPAMGAAVTRHSQQTLTDGRPLTRETAKQLRRLLFGSSKGCFNAEWLHQNFIFSTTPGLEYGLVQHKGGPCGVLATVQAYILKHLLFISGSSDVASVQDRNNALINAIIDILWKVKSNDPVVLALPSVQHSSNLTADLIDQLALFDKSSKDDVIKFLQQNLNYFTGSGQPGCILLLISAIFTRGIQRIVDDMDEPTNKLIGRHSYCTQDLVNLLLVGRAVSNTHNGIIKLGTGNESTQLKGIHCQSEIGFLSLFEYYKSCTVGSHYKQPKHPIWVVCSESHFSILFAANEDLFVRNPTHFDLIYYNGLGEQDEEIRLTIDITHKTQPSNKEDDDLVPPLDLCIRTCWDGAHINWNGTNPLL